jgi:hypothetical protein
LSLHSAILKPANKNRLHYKNKTKGKEKRKHRPKGLILKDIKPAKAILEGRQEMIQHDLLNLLVRTVRVKEASLLPREREYLRSARLKQSKIKRLQEGSNAQSPLRAEKHSILLLKLNTYRRKCKIVDFAGALTVHPFLPI